MEIKFTIKKSLPVTIALYNADGHLVKTLYQEKPSIGSHSLTFQMGELSAGAYLISVATQEGTRSENLMVVR
jgi:uncharacterized protein YfaS (alpha-2-macroglobulin family)